MASESAWNQGWAQGADAVAHRRARKEELSDEDRHSKVQMYAAQLNGLYSKLPTVKDNPQEYAATVKDMQTVLGNVRELLHPDKAPGALSKMGHLITDALHITDSRADAANRNISNTYDDSKNAELLASGAPPSPQEQATQDAEAKSAGATAAVRSGQKEYVDLFPNATPEEQTANLNSLVQQHFGITGRGSWSQVSGKINGEPVTLNFDKNTNRYTYPSGEPVPLTDLEPGHWVPDPKQTAFTQDQKDYESDVTSGKFTGSFASWKAKQSAVGHEAGKPESFDKQYQAILVKEQSGQPLTPDEHARKAAWQIWNRETKIEPGIERAAAFGAMRYIPVVDPANPENVVMMRAGDAARAGANTPASIGFQTDKTITRYMTAGQGGTNINYFNTATDHLNILREAGEALNNGDIPTFNKLANQFATATGDPAPTNFDAVRSAVAGELSKTFKGTGATDQEISEINQTINNAQSPEQINGAINYYSRLMGSKIRALKSQYDAAKSGQPNFPADNNPPNGRTPGGTSHQVAPKGATHKIEYPPKSGHWYYADKDGNNLGAVPK